MIPVTKSPIKNMNGEKHGPAFFLLQIADLWNSSPPGERGRLSPGKKGGVGP